MTSFDVRVQAQGETNALFKTVSDFISYLDFGSGKFTRTSDDLVSFSYPITLGVFRLLLDGQCQLVDRDLDNHVSLVTISSRDRGGKGKLEAKVRISLEESNNVSHIVCGCEVTQKGMLNRVNLPIENIFSEKIKDALDQIIAESTSSILIDDFVAEEVVIENVPAVVPQLIEKALVDSMVRSGNLRKADQKKPLWVLVLQFPSKFVTIPFSMLKSVFVKR